MTYTCANEKELTTIAEHLLNAYPNERVFGFYGEMGVGKTTFIKVICRLLNVDEITSSPTFAIVNEYITGDGMPVYHFDFYRVENLEEVYQIGFRDYVYSGSYCFIEWPEKIEAILQDDCIKVEITSNENGERVFRF